MEGISSKALNANYAENKKGYNGNEIQYKEFYDGSGLVFYDFNARYYDQQNARFLQIDPLSEEAGQESLTPYHFGFNNPIYFNDPDGKCPCYILPVIEAIVAAVTTETAVAAGGAVAVTAVASNPGMVIEAVNAHAQLTNSTGQVSMPLGGFGSIPINIYKPSNSKSEEIVITPAEKAKLNSPYILPPDIVKPVKPNLPNILKAEHRKNARPSTKNTHQKGQTRKAQDRNGSKGMELPPRKRPPGHKGPWPPKENNPKKESSK